VKRVRAGVKRGYRLNGKIRFKGEQARKKEYPPNSGGGFVKEGLEKNGRDIAGKKEGKV